MKTFEDATLNPDEVDTGETMLRQVRDTAGEMELRGERCVRENPIPSIAAAFGGGLLIGLAIGFGLSESRPRHASDILRDRASWWMRRLF